MDNLERSSQCSSYIRESCHRSNIAKRSRTNTTPVLGFVQLMRNLQLRSLQANTTSRNDVQYVLAICSEQPGLTPKNQHTHDCMESTHTMLSCLCRQDGKCCTWKSQIINHRAPHMMGRDLMLHLLISIPGATKCTPQHLMIHKLISLWSSFPHPIIVHCVKPLVRRKI